MARLLADAPTELFVARITTVRIFHGEDDTKEREWYAGPFASPAQAQAAITREESALAQDLDYRRWHLERFGLAARPGWDYDDAAVFSEILSTGPITWTPLADEA